MRQLTIICLFLVTTRQFMSRCSSNKDCDEKKSLQCIVNECKCAPGKFYEYDVNPNNAKCRIIILCCNLLKLNFLF